MYLDYEYKQKERRNGNRFVAVRDRGENALFEAERKGNEVILTTYWRNMSTTRFSMPAEMFEKLYEDLKISK